VSNKSQYNKNFFHVYPTRIDSQLNCRTTKIPISSQNAQSIPQHLVGFGKFRLKILIKCHRITGADLFSCVFQTTNQTLKQYSRNRKHHFIVLGHRKYSISHPRNSNSWFLCLMWSNKIFAAFDLSSEISCNAIVFFKNQSLNHAHHLGRIAKKCHRIRIK
jgi:hypothetical protein